MVDVMIIAHNEALNLPHSLAALRGWANKVYVIDSGSTDGTQDLARSFGAEVVHHDWPGYAEQKNWAIDNLQFTSDWTLILDADEVIQDDMKRAIEELVSRDVDEVPESAFNINRYFVFLGKRIRHCGYYPSWNIRLFKRGRARYEQRDVHEHMLVDGPIGFLEGHMEHHDRRGLEDYFAKHNRYSTLEAREIVKITAGASKAGAKSSFFADAITRRRWIKTHVYPRLPFKWAFRFLYAYVVRLGFLDGLTGARFCLFLASYELMIHLKIIEMRQQEDGAERGSKPAA